MGLTLSCFRPKPSKTVVRAGPRPAKPLTLNTIAAADISDDSLPYAEPKSPRGMPAPATRTPFGVNPVDPQKMALKNSPKPKNRAGSNGHDSRHNSRNNTPASTRNNTPANSRDNTPTSSPETKPQKMATLLNKILPSNTPTAPPSDAVKSPLPVNKQLEDRSGHQNKPLLPNTPTDTPSGPAKSVNEQLDYTGRVSKDEDGSVDTSHRLLDSYPGKVDLDPVVLHVLREIGSGTSALDLARWREAVQERLEREIRSWVKVDGPFVQYIGFADIDGAPAALTQLTESTGAKEYLTEKPVDDRRRLIVTFARALARLHEQELSHGSIEPRYFTVNKSGEAKVAGFCFPRMVEEEREKIDDSEDFHGSARYTAPEVLENRQTDTRSDVYSFALVALELMTGRQPFSSTQQEAALIQRIKQGEDPLVKDFAELQSDSWWSTFKSCLSRDPNLRPSMEKIYRDLSATVHQ